MHAHFAHMNNILICRVAGDAHVIAEHGFLLLLLPETRAIYIEKLAIVVIIVAIY